MSIGRVYEFHEKFGLPLAEADAMMGDPEAEDFRVRFLQEELNELNDALVEGDRVAAFDALLDLVYVAYGTALWLGIDPAQWEAGFHAVHSANMAKVKVLNAADSKRGSKWDVRKPDGWVAPEARLKEILAWKS